MSAESIRISVAGWSIAALAWGPGDGPLAVCLHGYPDTAHTWRHLGPVLAGRGWRVVAPFMRGYHPTGPAPDGAYQIGALARDALDLHRALGGDERAVLIGHDWGATAAYAAAVQRPGTFAQVVTLAVPPPRAILATLSSRPWLALRQLRLSWYMLFQQLPGLSEASLERLIPSLWAAWSPGYDAADDIAHVWEALPTAAHRTAALRSYRALIQPWYRSRAYADEEARVFAVPACPLLFLYGENDGCILPELSARAVDELGAHGRAAAVPGAGHFLQLEQPGLLGRLIAEFLE